MIQNKGTLNYIIHRGERALASCLGGGDLDGDIFNLILDVSSKFRYIHSCLSVPQPRLLPTKQFEPGEYPAVTIRSIPNVCGISDVADFVIDYVSFILTSGSNDCEMNCEK